MNDGATSTVGEKASKYIEMAKICQEQLWKRRHIEWRTGFALWTSLAVAGGFIYRYAQRPLPDPGKWILLAVILLVFSVIVLLHRRHLKAIFISNERDLDFLNYYRDRAAWELSNEDFKNRPPRPPWADDRVEKWSLKDEETKFYNHRKPKMRHHYTPVVITSLIALLSWSVLALMCLE